MADERGVCTEHAFGALSGDGDEVGVGDDPQQPQRRSRARLGVAEHVALAALVAGDVSGIDRLWQAGGVGTVAALLLLPVTAITSVLLGPNTSRREPAPVPQKVHT